tara:strand:- start:27122 stop:28078 length:957 start_codon:yes stop_codon:yes gene_type:complete
VSTFKETFIDQDINLLNQFCSLKCVIESGPKALIEIISKLNSSRVVFIWFGSMYAFYTVLLSKIFQKKSIICLGGADVSSIPEIGYGIWLKHWKRPFLRFTMRYADKLLPVASSMIPIIKKNSRYDGRNIEFLSTCVDTNKWSPNGQKKRMVLTVGICQNEVRLKKKGIDFFIETANRLSKIQFMIIGTTPEILKHAGLNLPENVKVLPKMKHEELLQYYQQTFVYCQPSRSEGIPNTLLEAMSCGCIPVGTDADGIPEAIGQTGKVVPVGDIDSLTVAIKKTLSWEDERGGVARERILEHFPLSKRAERLKEIIAEL